MRLDLPNRRRDVIDVRRFGEQQVLRHGNRRGAHLPGAFEILQAVAIHLQAPFAEQPREPSRGEGFLEETVEVLLAVSRRTGNPFRAHRPDELLA